MKRDKTRLKEALREAGVSEWHWRAASILWSVNGIDNALEYVHGLQERKERADDESKGEDLGTSERSVCPGCGTPWVIETTMGTASTNADLGKLYRDWLSVRDGNQSAYPSVETLVKYQRWAEELVIGGRHEKQGTDFRRFCRVAMVGRAWHVDLMTVGVAYHNSKDFPAPEGWECLEEGLG